MKMFRFAVAGPGHIARQFVTGLTALPGAELAGAASNTPGRAEQFIHEFSQFYPRAAAYDSYEALAADPSVDAVYVSNLNTQHADTAVLFLRHGKPVICEKPFALNAGQAKRMIECAKENNTFLMEAMWTRFQPANRKAAEWVRLGRIGDVISVSAEFGMELMTSADRRTVALEKGGGALLDLGIYPISYLSMIFGRQPSEIKTLVSKAITGVDASFEALFRYGEMEKPLSRMMQTAHITVAMDRPLSQTMTITGTTGMIRIPRFWCADSAALYAGSPTDGEFDAPAEVFSPAWVENGYQYEAAEVMERVTAGEKESSIMPLSETLSIMQTMDAIRKDWGLVYPQER